MLINQETLYGLVTVPTPVTLVEEASDRECHTPQPIILLYLDIFYTIQS